jgi:phosphate starvation-inducible membrane PsiE
MNGFLGSLACVPAALLVASATGDVGNRSVVLALLCYVGLGVGARALIPTHEQALVVAYWAMSILALVYLGFAPWIPRSKLATAR